MRQKFQNNTLFKPLTALGYTKIKGTGSSESIVLTLEEALERLIESRRFSAKVDQSNEGQCMAISKFIEEELESKGHFSSKNSFSVKGHVISSGGVSVADVKLCIFDVNLKGVIVFWSVKSINEILEKGGFDYLGETTSTKDGKFKRTFYKWQYNSAERRKADIVVLAVDEKGNIIGRSRLYTGKDYQFGRELRNVEAIIKENDNSTLYDLVSTQRKTHSKCE